MSTEITPFTIDTPQADLDDLQARLARTRFAKGLPDVSWTQGMPETHARELVSAWTTSFDWRTWEAKLNSYPQFTTEIDGQKIHFLHIRSAVESATPLMLFHGWPGSILEFLDVIDPLAETFDLIIPSLPGFGFSGPTNDSGWNSERMAKAMTELMTRLEYDRFGVQGGDWGAFVAADVARVAPDRVIGVHLNAATFGFIPFHEVGDEERATLTDVEQARLDRLANYLSDGNGYFQIQATRPQTVAFGLTDSPVGQLTWIGEKFHDWAHPKGSIDSDFVLAHATLYWLTETAASSARTYWESMHSGSWPTPVSVPTGVAAFAEDVAIRRYGEDGFNIVHWSDFDQGGHFAATEAPDLFVTDVRTFFSAL
jgi:pimeloyl-ACP methyl ester carboxylesterase